MCVIWNYMQHMSMMKEITSLRSRRPLPAKNLGLWISRNVEKTSRSNIIDILA